MRLAVMIFVISSIWASSGAAGAWLREKGSGFSAIGATVRGSRTEIDYETKLYLEYGVGNRLTVGLDADQQPTNGHVLIFARVPLGAGSGKTRFAFELGVGGHYLQGPDLSYNWANLYKATFAVGRGFSTQWGNGWFGAEAAVEHRTGLSDLIYKFDAVAGLSSGQRIRPLVKLETSYTDGEYSAWSLTPGIMFEVGKKNTWIVGIERKSAAKDTIGLTIGLWRNF